MINTMRSIAFFGLATAFLLPLSMARAQVTITSTSGSTMNGSGQVEALDFTSPMGSTEIPDMTPQFNVMQDADGYLMDMPDQFLTPAQAAEREKAKLAEEERKRKENTVQIYRGAEANNKKPEPKRTHLMYEQTRY